MTRGRFETEGERWTLCSPAEDENFAELIATIVEAKGRVELGVMDQRRRCGILRESAVGGRKAGRR